MTDNVAKPYDAALSFLENDEEFARKVYSLISPRMRTFVYLFEQAKLAGADGQKKFNRVFGDEAKVVVVLYRPQWGKTTWTRVEETAVTNRGLKHGYDFTFFIMLENCEPPKWLPNKYLWWGYERFGIDGLAGAIEARVQEAGGEIIEESPQEKAIRMSREIGEAQERKQILASQGVELADSSISDLFTQLEGLTIAANESNPSLNLRYEQKDRSFVIKGSGYSIIVNWQLAYSNSLQYSALTIRLFRGYAGLGSGAYLEKPMSLREETLHFDLAPIRRAVWRSGKNSYSASDLAGHVAELFFNQIHKNGESSN